jgi:predicted RNA-binding protein with PUA-like domain
MKYWLLKTEPDTFSIDDLKKVKQEPWSGVRNYQARNNMRDMEIGDLCFIYHSSCEVPGIAGVGKVSKKAYPDKTAYDKKSEYYETKSETEKYKQNPTWVCPDISFVEKFKNFIPLTKIKSDPKLASMKLLQKGSRLSVQPVTKQQFEYIKTIV